MPNEVSSLIFIGSASRPCRPSCLCSHSPWHNLDSTCMCPRAPRCRDRCRSSTSPSSCCSRWNISCWPRTCLSPHCGTLSSKQHWPRMLLLHHRGTRSSRSRWSRRSLCRRPGTRPSKSRWPDTHLSHHCGTRSSRCRWPRRSQGLRPGSQTGKLRWSRMSLSRHHVARQDRSQSWMWM